MKSYIKERVARIKEAYKIEGAQRVSSDFFKEGKETEAYHGRELLELMQNADDELIKELSEEIRIKFIDNTLTVSNFGTPFTKAGIDSLMYSNLSPKREKLNVIGNKGTGFRSILGWADTVEIHSDELHIQFSDAYAQEQLVEIFGDGFVKEEKLKAATLVFPKWVEANESPYTTDIVIKVKDSAKIVDDIKAQIEALNGELLLFLNNTKVLTVETAEGVVRLKKEKCNRSSSKVYIEREQDGVKTESVLWHVKRQDSQYEDLNYSVIVAYKDNRELPSKQVLYSYFPTDVDFPYPVLLHANFNLDPSRNHLNKNDINNAIMETAAQLLVATAVDAAKGRATYEPLALLLADKGLSSELMHFKFDELLFSEIKNSKILPTVNGKYVALEDHPRFYSNRFAKVLKGKDFDKLLQYTENELVLDFLDNNVPWKYSEDEFIKYLNAWAKGHPPDKKNLLDHTMLVVDYAELHPLEKSECPKIIFDADGKLIGGKTPVFIKEDRSEVTPPPAFTGIRFMHSEMRKTLNEDINLKQRVFVAKLRCFHVQEYSALPILNKMRTSIQKNIAKEEFPLARRKTWECLKWVWKNRNGLTAVGEGVRVFFPTRGGGFGLSDEVYYGKEYGNDIGERLFVEAGLEGKLIADIQEEVGIENREEAVEFLQHLKVAGFPRIIRSKIEVSKAYRDNIIEKLEYPFMLYNQQYKSSVELKFETKEIQMSGSTIPELDEIMKNCSTGTILDWLLEDSAINQILKSHKDLNGATEIRWGYKGFHPLTQVQVYPYLCERFMNEEWIEVNGTKYPMKSCILQAIGDTLKPYLVGPDLNNYVTDKDYARIMKEKYGMLLQEIGVPESYGNLAVDRLYEVLNHLADIPDSGPYAKKIYDAVIKSKRKLQKEELSNPIRQEYLSKGKAYCKNGRGYQPVSGTFYIDSVDVCRTISAQKNLVDIQTHQSPDRIEEFFGIKKLSLKGKLAEDPVVHSLNVLFQEEFEAYKRYAYCYRLQYSRNKEEAQQFSRLGVTLCESIKAVYDKDTVELEDYEFLPAKGNRYYIRIPKECSTLGELHNLDMSDALANLLGSFFGSGDSYQAFKGLYSIRPTDWEKHVLQNFSDREILTESMEMLESGDSVEDEFNRIVKKLGNVSEEEMEELKTEIDFTNLNKPDNSPLIIQLFRRKGMDVDQYNEEATISYISLLKYYEGEIKRLKNRFEDKFKHSIYARLKEQSIKEKQTLQQEFLEYHDRNVSMKDSVLFDPEQQLLDELQIDLSVEAVDLRALYNRNESAWLKTVNHPQLATAFLQKSQNGSLIYFAEFEELTKRYEEYCQQEAAFDEEQPAAAEHIPPVVKVETLPNAQAKKPGGTHIGGTGYSGHKNDRTLAKTGLLGERYIYKYLQSISGKVEWVSENAKKDGVNPEGSAAFGYDMRYADAEDNTVYVEVKASTSNAISFYLSEHEYQFAVNNIGAYQLFFVTNATCAEKAEIIPIEDLFKNGDFNREKYSVVTESEFSISADIVQTDE